MFRPAKRGRRSSGHIREAIAFQIKGLRLIGEPVPEPSAWTGGVEQVARASIHQGRASVTMQVR
jgi:hypothetical protein